jgi:hypothetical protein
MDDKQAWHEAATELERLKAFVDKPRCINCEEFSAGVCGHYGPIPDHYWYKVTECAKWFVKIPF